ncbi:hypothetical protein H7K45_02105 [Mycobacterium yunnanensis]|uniref:Uncharacterized protein n=1 Tax=Mycobacterium yunnanensis TaxID=368477 RepID=A0A9X2YH61_9MYCO|nr:hypothetical protein [Mycobacterium yunnanensis]MCV7419323.1 hypothetical protein [Mycobacterium yunnanensis]
MIDALIRSGEVSQEDVQNNKLHYRLKLFGEPVLGGPRHGYLRLSCWAEGLGADRNAERFSYSGPQLDRPGCDDLVSGVGIIEAPKLIRDLVRDGNLDLTKDEFQGVVAGVWSMAEPFVSGLDWDTWVELFLLNGFTNDGTYANRPAGPLDLYRGATEDKKRGMAWTTDIDVARSFAYDRISNRSVGNVYVAHVAPAVTLAFICDRGLHENEWVIDPRALRDDDIRLVEVVEDDPRPASSRRQRSQQ